MIKEEIKLSHRRILKENGIPEPRSNYQHLKILALTTRYQNNEIDLNEFLTRSNKIGYLLAQIDNLTYK